MNRVLRRAAFVIVGTGLLLLVACGGGGSGGGSQTSGTGSNGGSQGTGTGSTGGSTGGSGSGSTPPETSFTVTPASLSIRTQVGSDLPTASLSVQISNQTGSAVFVQATSTSSGISSTTVQQTDTAATIEVDYRSFADIAPGTYDDTIQISLCADQQCNQVIGQTKNIPSHYAIDPIPANTPGFLPSTNSVSARALPFALDGGIASFDVAFVNTDATRVSLKPSWTGNSILQVTLTPLTASQGRVDIFYKSPQAVGTGTFDDVVTLAACVDSACSGQLIGSPSRISSEYVVSNVVPGPNGYTFDLVDGTATDLAWDSLRNRIYLSVPASAPASANSVAVLDPVAEKIEATGSVGADPGVLALSDDDQYLYVGLRGTATVQRLTLPTLAPDLTIPFGSGSPSEVFRAHDIKVLPGNPRSVAIALWDTSVLSSLGAYIYDDAIARPNAGRAFIDWLAWGPDANTLYGFDSESSGHDISTMSVNTTGVTLLNITMGPLSSTSTFGGINYDTGLVFADNGIVFDPATRQGTLPYILTDGGFPEAVLPDSKAGKVFLLTWNVDYRSGAALWTLFSYDFKTSAPIAKISLSGLDFPSYSRIRLLRWGPQGLAFATSNGKVALVRGAFVTAAGP